MHLPMLPNQLKNEGQKMMINSLARRKAVLTIAAATMLPGIGIAQSFPSRPIKLIVPFGPGGINDVAVRLLADRLTSKFKTPFVVENRPGAGAVAGTQFVARAPADGYTLLFGQPTAFTVNPNIQKNLPYNVQKDFVAVAPVYFVPIVMLARPDFPAKNLEEVIDLAKKAPKSLAYGSFGIGSSSHLVMEWLRIKSGADLVHVPYRGGAAATFALLSGEVPLSFDALPGALARIKSGQVKAISIFQNATASAAPDVPTTRGTKFAELDLPAWGGFFAPVDTPSDRLKFLTDAINSVVAEPQFADQLTQLGAEAFRGSPSDLTNLVASETEKIRRIIVDAKLTFEN